MRVTVCSSIGIIGSCLAYWFGGWDVALQTLIIFMAIDTVMGWTVAAVFNTSTKSDTGALKSSVGWKGLAKKGTTLLLVFIAVQLDKLLGTDIARNAVIIGFCTNELLSIAENAGLMGVPFPSVLTNAIDVLKKKEGKDNADI